MRKLVAILFAAIAFGAAVAAPAEAAPTWLPPTEMAKGVLEGDVAMDPQGDAVAAWVRYEPGASTIVTESRPAGGSWEAPVEVPSPAINQQPQLYFDDAGEAFLLWRRLENAEAHVVFASRPPGGSWSEPQQLSASGGGAQEGQLAVGPGGSLVAVWYRSDGSNYVIQATERPPGGSWSEPVDLSKPGESAQSPRIGLDAAGDATAVWARYDGTVEVIQEASRTSGGSWSEPTDISEEGKQSFAPALAVDPAGTAVAVWNREDESQQIAQSSTRASAAGAWSAPDEISSQGHYSEYPVVVLDRAGTATAVWNTDRGNDYAVDAASKSPGGTWSTPLQLSPDDVGVGFPKIAVDGDGDVISVWNAIRPLGGEGEFERTVQAVRLPAGGAWGAALNIGGGMEGNEPQVAMDDDGDALAIWRGYDGKELTVETAGFDGAGPQLRGLSIPATAVAGAPTAFSLAPLDVFSPPTATTWSFGDGASAPGPSVTHTFARPGTYAVTVTSTDALGNPRSASAQVTVGALPGALPPAKPLAHVARVVKVVHGKALLRITCPAGGDACTGLAKIGLRRPARHGRSHARPGSRTKTIAKHRFTVPAGHTATAKAKLGRAASAAVDRAARRGLKALLSGQGVDPRPILLKPAKK